MKAYIGPYKDDQTDDRDIVIHVDDYDVISADMTLSFIIIAVLKKFKENCNSYPSEFLDSDYYIPKITNEEKDALDKNAEEQWNKVLEHMIWSFEMIAHNNYDDDVQYDGGDCIKIRHEKIQQGLDLFAKYFIHLWT